MNSVWGKNAFHRWPDEAGLNVTHTCESSTDHGYDMMSLSSLNWLKGAPP
jgi:hypothetical protein